MFYELSFIDAFTHLISILNNKILCDGNIVRLIYEHLYSLILHI